MKNGGITLVRQDPCEVCGGIWYYKKTGHCRKCRRAAMKEAMASKPTWKPDGLKPGDDLSVEAIKAMKHVVYDDADVPQFDHVIRSWWP